MKPDDQSRLSRVAIVGGGRWSRVIVDVLAAQLPPMAGIKVYSPRAADVMTAWCQSRSLSDRVDVVGQLPKLPDDSLDAAIVVNSACDHVPVASMLLESGVPTLVEKPFALDAASAGELIALAHSRRILLGVAQVFRFATNLSYVGDYVKKMGVIEAIELEWADPLFECRHGEAKRIDASIPVIVDVLPHVLSVLKALSGDEEFSFRDLAIDRHGAKVEMVLASPRTEARVLLQRCAATRVRYLTVRAGKGQASLDFSDEPGKLTVNDSEVVWPSEVDFGPRPLSGMLSSFLDSVVRDQLDPRLSPMLGLHACEVADQALVRYRSQQTATLVGALIERAPATADLIYGLTEIVLSSSGRRLESDLQPVRVWNALLNLPHSEVIAAGCSSTRFAEFVCHVERGTRQSGCERD